MTRRRSRSWLASCALSCVLSYLAAACASSPPEAPPDDAPLPWTTEFQRPALLVAEEIRIEGPPGLFEHFAVRVEPAYHDRQEATTPQGYLQTIDLRAGAPAEIRGYLDQLELAALRRLSVLERPGETPVAIWATGEVFWARTDTGEERRVPELRLVGLRPARAGAGSPPGR